MPGTSLVKIIGLQPLAKKLDGVVEITAARTMVQDVGNLGKTTLVGLMPSNWERPRQVNLATTENSARIEMPRYPYVFFERGSQRHSGGAASRAHRTKTSAQFKQGNYFIKPRRYLARTRAIIRKALKQAVIDRAAKIQQMWSS